VIKVFLIVSACLGPQHTECKMMEAINLTTAGPVACQKARIPVSSYWRYEVQVEQGFLNWAIFTRCELVEPEKDGGSG
jgi:hypothetical protein